MTRRGVAVIDAAAISSAARSGRRVKPVITCKPASAPFRLPTPSVRHLHGLRGEIDGHKGGRAMVLRPVKLNPPEIHGPSSPTSAGLMTSL